MPNLKEYFNKMPRLGTLSTASKDGKVNAAYFMSVQMADKDTVTMACGDNRTFANLQENPNAVFLIMEPGKTLQDWKGRALERVFFQSPPRGFIAICSSKPETAQLYISSRFDLRIRLVLVCSQLF